MLAESISILSVKKAQNKKNFFLKTYKQFAFFLLRRTGSIEVAVQKKYFMKTGCTVIKALGTPGKQ